MSKIIFETTANAITTRSGYIQYFNEYEEAPDEFGKIKRNRKRMQKIVPEHQGVIFDCPAPGCGYRNDISILSAKKTEGDALVFDCKKCGREIEVYKPHSSIILP